MPTKRFELLTDQFLRLAPLPLGYVGMIEKLRGKESNPHLLIQSQASLPFRRPRNKLKEPGAIRTRDLKLRKLALLFR